MLTQIKEIINDYKNGNSKPREITLAVLGVQTKETKTKKMYKSYELTDFESTIILRDFDLLIPTLGENNCIEFLGQVDEFGGYNIKIKNFYNARELEKEEKMDNNIDVEGLKEILWKRINEIEDDFLKNLTISVLKENPYFFKAPGAVYYHHNFENGLLQHTVEVLELSYNMSKVYPQANKDVIIAGAILHDIGKIKVYDLEEKSGLSTPVYNEEEGLLEHIPYGILMLKEWEMKNYVTEKDSEKLKLINHIILSHHGEIEMGSPVKPSFLEAVLISKADSASSIVGRIIFSKLPAGELTFKDTKVRLFKPDMVEKKMA